MHSAALYPYLAKIEQQQRRPEAIYNWPQFKKLTVQCRCGFPFGLGQPFDEYSRAFAVIHA
ncbi:hypothetical protein MES4922_90024 [Mesorhizobium ventifaucium]|uniref:Uncharacterized protein n=1 Tax=Mesorhizobium ventifaucium TaxID=666020 RepID=A0ABM9EF98_9HYPH|nr:hypothetical protein MES4922_90024 [Mesorhizobium ventifaucium]